MLHVVTGAAGFIGSRLVAALNQAGITEILAVDNLQNGAKSKNLATLEIDDYLDKREFLAQLESGRLDGAIETVLHQGACSDTMETDGRYVMENNYAYSKALFDWCQDDEVPLIYASSARSTARAGNSARRARTKIRSTSTPTRSTCSTSTCASTRARTGRRSPACATSTSTGRTRRTRGRMASVAYHAFNQFRDQGRVKLFVGSDGYENGAQQRDFVHVDDAVSVNLWLMENRNISGIFNCGSGRAQTFNDVAAAVINTVEGFDLSIEEIIEKGFVEYIPFPPQLVGKYQSYTQADLARLREAGYEGSFRSVEEGVADYARELLK
jgi:ADP-L-glycero-D-manno-heptose 6-epimerase